MDRDESRAITATTVLTGGIIGIGVVGGMSGITSSMGVKRDGVYSDFKCLVVRGVQHADGVYELYFAIEEKLDDKTGAVKASKVLQPPPEARARDTPRTAPARHGTRRGAPR